MKKNKKKIITLLACVAMLTSCNKKENEKAKLCPANDFLSTDVEPNPNPNPSPDNPDDNNNNDDNSGNKGDDENTSDKDDNVNNTIFEIENIDDTIKITGIKSEYVNTIETIIIPETIQGKTVTSIGANAFSNATKVTNIKISKTITTISNNTSTNSPFDLLENINQIEVDTENKYFKVEGNCLLKVNDNKSLNKYLFGWGDVIFPTYLYDISSADNTRLFANNNSITSITLHSGALTMANDTFYDMPTKIKIKYSSRKNNFYLKNITVIGEKDNKSLLDLIYHDDETTYTIEVEFNDGSTYTIYDLLDNGSTGEGSDN